LMSDLGNTNHIVGVWASDLIRRFWPHSEHLGETELILICLVVVALLAIVARRTRIPHPILLTIGGVILALIPGLPEIHLAPALVFNLFLPPLLYPAAVYTSWRDFRTNLRPILLMATVLVLITMAATAYVFHSLVGLPLAVGFVFGSLLSPPDAVDALSVTPNLLCQLL